jgi:hypothetical protein
MSEKDTSSTQQLQGAKVATEGQALTERLCKAGQVFPSVQIIYFQRRAMLEQERFESIVNSHYQQH